MTDEQIKAHFLAEGFTIKDGLLDLKPYVYSAARAIEAAAIAPLLERIAELEAKLAQQAEAQEPDDAALLKALNEIKPMDRTKLFEMAAPLTQEEIAEAESDRAIPKAWANFTPDGNIRIWSKKPESAAWSGLELAPLFTRPQPAQKEPE
jgi:hypothetical protein